MTDFVDADHAAAPAAALGRKHIVDALIEERAPRLSSSPAWPALRPGLYRLLNYAKARSMANAIARMGGVEAMDHLSRLLALRLETTGLERAEPKGSFLILANHPTGVTDGVALYDALKPVRPDLLFYANSDAHRVCPGFTDVLIPVEWVPAKRTRERTRITLKMTAEAVEQGRPIMIFPAGRLARMRQGQLTDPEWQPSAVSIARKYNLPILPIYMSGPYAFLFHFFDRFSKELRDITLFHELLNKEGRTYRLTIGPMIPASAAAGDAAVQSRRIKHYVEKILSRDPNAVFDPKGPECDVRDQPQGASGGPDRP
jgi:putative hemolysin